MTAPIVRVSKILDEILENFDISHDFGRRQAWESVLDYATDNLTDAPECDDFLAEASSRLGFAEVSRESLCERVRLPKGAWVDIWISDEDDEVAITGTAEGLQYLIDVLRRLKGSSDPGEHVHLDRAMLPMTENSANLVLFKEEEQWFTGAPDAALEPYPPREIETKSIYAIQSIHFPPDDLPMTANRLYRVMSCELTENLDECGIKEFPDGDRERYRRFGFVADSGQRFQYIFHLDDPGVNFFTHREIVSLALKTV